MPATAIETRVAIKADLPRLACLESCRADGFDEAAVGALRKRRDILMLVAPGDNIAAYIAVSLQRQHISLERLTCVGTEDGYLACEALLARMTAKCNPSRPEAQAVLPETAVLFLNMLKRAGFKAAKLLRGYYGERDAIRMVYHA